MKRFLSAPPIWLCLLLASLPLHAAFKEVEVQSRNFLVAGRFGDLETLYATVAAQPFSISEEWPDLDAFFAGMSLKWKDDEPLWTKRRAQIDAWLSVCPDSIPAHLTLSHYLESYSWKGRGTGYASTVTDEGWKLFAERRLAAEKTLADGPVALRKELFYDYLMAYILTTDEKRFGEARLHVEAVNRRAPEFYPAYSLISHFLLPRWYGEPGDCTAYAHKVSDKLGGAKGDMLYASLMGAAAYEDEIRFPDTHKPDYPRMIRGFEALIAHPDNRFRRIAAYSYASGLMGDWKRTRTLLLKLGPVQNQDYEPWNGLKQYEDFLGRSGARNDLITAELLEGRGRLAEAEACYLAFEPDRLVNGWLSGFYLRHGEAEKFAACTGVPDLMISADKASIDETADRCILFETLRDFKRGAPFAERFDQVRGHNFTAKTFFYEAALFSGDVAAAKNARDAIINRKTDRKSYQLAQNILANDANADAFQPDDFDWNDDYSRQGAIIVALRLYERGKPEAARKLLRAALHASTYQWDSEHIRSLLYHPPTLPAP